MTIGAKVEGRDPLASCSDNIIGLPAVTCFLSVIMFHCLTDGSDDVSLQDGKPNRLMHLSLLLIKSIGANHTSAGQTAESSGQDVNVPP